MIAVSDDGSSCFVDDEESPAQPSPSGRHIAQSDYGSCTFKVSGGAERREEADESIIHILSPDFTLRLGSKPGAPVRNSSCATGSDRWLSRASDRRTTRAASRLRGRQPRPRARHPAPLSPDVTRDVPLTRGHDGRHAQVSLLAPAWRFRNCALFAGVEILFSPWRIVVPTS
jgi:hypothetical protein